MKKVESVNKRIKTNKPAVKTEPAYYFHADEDFREDWDWGKSKMTTSKAISKPLNKFEI